MYDNVFLESEIGTMKCNTSTTPEDRCFKKLGTQTTKDSTYKLCTPFVIRLNNGQTLRPDRIVSSDRAISNVQLELACVCDFQRIFAIGVLY